MSFVLLAIVLIGLVIALLQVFFMLSSSQHKKTEPGPDEKKD